MKGGVVEKNSLGMQLVLIPPGEFLMGGSETLDELKNEFPVIEDSRGTQT